MSSTAARREIARTQSTGRRSTSCGADRRFAASQRAAMRMPTGGLGVVRACHPQSRAGTALDFACAK